MQDTELPEKIEPTTPNFQTELAAQIAEIAPEALSDGKLDVAKLRELVNGDAETSQEKFGLFWPGKRAAQALAQIPTTATLVPAPEESEDWENTKNLFIEGDNLEVLKALQNSYRRKVKMIYIDPPYNKEKDFIYPDNFAEGLEGYLLYTGQVDQEGRHIESKKEKSGRKHSQWLSMMYPRLQLAKSLLTDDGVIFLSIDDNEYVHLKKLCDEVFGEENYLALLPRLTKKGGKSTDSFAKNNDMVFVYARNKNTLRLNQSLHTDSGFSQVDEYVDKRGKYKLNQTLDYDSLQYNKTMDYEIEIEGHKIYPGGSQAKHLARQRGEHKRIDWVWRWSRAKFEFGLNNGFIVLKKGKDGMPRIYTKTYENATIDRIGDGKYRVVEQARTKAFSTIQLVDNKYSNDSSSKEIKELIGDNFFEYTKPVSLIKLLAYIGSDKDSIIMDFFSGSGTTGHAVMELNAEDGGSRTHIQVQLPERIEEGTEAYNAGFKTISEIGKKRLTEAAKKIKSTYASNLNSRSTPLDTGFRVYKLAQSNFVQWNENKAKDDIQQAVLDFATNKKPDAAPESLLAEIMLQARIQLSAHIEKRILQSGGWVYVVDGGNLIAYVADEQITEAQVNEIADLAPAKLVILDSAFNGNNALKINVMNICKEKFIKEFKTI